jgi:hypothetical protein
VNTSTDVLSCLEIDILKIIEEEFFTFFSGSKYISISNIKFPIPRHPALFFKEHTKVKEKIKSEKGLSQPHYLIQHIGGYYTDCDKENKQDLHSSIIEKKNTVLVP